MDADSLQRDLWSFSGAIKACGKAGHWESALTLFSSAQALRLGVNEVMISSTVSACAKASQWHLAFLLVASAPQMSNAFSFCAAISGQKSWPLALHLFRMMSQTSVEGDLACRNALFLACHRALAWQQAWTSVEGQTSTKNAEAEGCIPSIPHHPISLRAFRYPIHSATSAYLYNHFHAHGAASEAVSFQAAGAIQAAPRG